MNDRTKVSMILVGIIAIGSASVVLAYSALTATSSGIITSTTTPANLKFTAASADNGGSCSFSTFTASCSGWAIGQGGIDTMTLTIANIGGQAANPTLTTSGIIPGDAGCTSSGPATIPGGMSETYTVTYTAGQLTGSASCTLSIT